MLAKKFFLQVVEAARDDLLAIYPVQFAKAYFNLGLIYNEE